MALQEVVHSTCIEWTTSKQATQLANHIAGYEVILTLFKYLHRCTYAKS